MHCTSIRCIVYLNLKYIKHNEQKFQLRFFSTKTISTVTYNLNRLTLCLKIINIIQKVRILFEKVLFSAFRLFFSVRVEKVTSITG